MNRTNKEKDWEKKLAKTKFTTNGIIKPCTSTTLIKPNEKSEARKQRKIKLRLI